MSFWPALCIVVVGLEGLIGIILNSLVLFFLLRGRLRTKSTYRVAMTVSTIHLIGMSALSGVTTLCHLFHDQNYLLVFFGLLALLPRWVSDAAVVLFMFFVFAMWELTPASCILQYLALCKPHFSNIKRLLIAYAVCLGLVGWSSQYYTTFHAIPEDRHEWEQTTRDIFSLSQDEKVFAYGAKLLVSEKSNVTVIPFAACGVGATYFIAYATFIFCCYRIYRAINSHHIDNKSERTKLMERQFFRTLVLQGLVSLLVLSAPMSCFFVALVSGFNMDRLTLFLTFSLWTVPTVQGLVSLSFVVRAKSSSSEGSSTTRIRPVEQRSASEIA